MAHSRGLKLAPALLVAVLALSFTAGSADAFWHRWGCGYWHAPVYRSAAYYPGYYSGYGAYAYQYPSWSYWGPHVTYSYSYAVPSYYLPSYYPSGDCCGWLGPQVRWIVPGDQFVPGEAYAPTPAPADAPPPLPEPPLPQPKTLPEGAGGYQLPPAGDEPRLPPPPAPEPNALTPPQPDSVIPADPAPAFPLLPGGGTAQPATSTILTVQVPADARVYVNGMLTKTPGTQRQYLSRGLAPGQRYTYEIRAEVARGDQLVSRTQRVEVRSGESAQVAFRLDPQVASRPAAGTQTLLKVHVPDTAQVTLEGQATRATGSQRAFLTQELSEGQVWEGYRVVVQWERDGAVQTLEKAIDLVGGQTHELSFDFASQQVALR